MNIYNALDPKTEPAIEQLEAEAVNSAKYRKPLYEKRRKIFPKRAEGRFRQFKWIVMLVTLGIYYLTPWIRWDRGAQAPDQAVLVDLVVYGRTLSGLQTAGMLLMGLALWSANRPAAKGEAEAGKMAARA